MSTDLKICVVTVYHPSYKGPGITVCDLDLVTTNLGRYLGYFTKMTFGAKYLTLSVYHSLDSSPGKHLQIA